MPMPLVGVGLALVLSYIALLTVQVYTPWTEYTPQCADFLPEGAHRHQIGPPPRNGLIIHTGRLFIWRLAISARSSSVETLVRRTVLNHFSLFEAGNCSRNLQLQIMKNI